MLLVACTPSAIRRTLSVASHSPRRLVTSTRHPPVGGRHQVAQVAAHVLLEEQPAVRRTAHVHALGAGEEQHLPAGPHEPVAPVGLLAEEEVPLVERADLVERGPPDGRGRRDGERARTQHSASRRGIHDLEPVPVLQVPRRRRAGAGGGAAPVRRVARGGGGGLMAAPAPPRGSPVSSPCRLYCQVSVSYLPTNPS